MDPRKSPERPITKRAQLLVEGRTPFIFFTELRNNVGLQEIEIHDFGAVEKLRPFLVAFCNRPEFKTVVTALAIIRDAETVDPASPTPPSAADRAFQSVCSALQAAGQPIPATPIQFTETRPRVGVFMLPNCVDDGMLETLCFDSVKTDAIASCVNTFFSCMDTATGTSPRNLFKARAFAYLATQNISDPLVGRAAQAGIWPWEHSLFGPLKSFLRDLESP